MGRHSETHRVEPAGHLVQYVGGARDDHRQGPWPGCVSEPLGGRWDGRRPVRQLVGGRQMDDQRMIARATLDGEDSSDRLDVRGIGGEPVHGLGGKGDETAGADRPDRASDVRRDHRHDQ